MAYDFKFPLTKKTYPYWAVYYVKDGYSIKEDVIMGRQAAGWSFLKALIENRSERLGLYIKSDEAISDFKASAGTLLDSDEKLLVNFIPYNEPFKSQEFGGIFVPGPGIAKFADERSIYGNNIYSIVGITHTTATHRVMSDLRNIITHDVAPWDALICTSKCVLDTVKRVFEEEMTFLLERFGNIKEFTLPELPIIPLGIDYNEFNYSDDFRNDSRKSLNINNDDIVVSFVGRLSFHAKAHHYPMYVALQNLSKKISNKKIHLIQTGWFGNEFIEKAFHEEADKLCPDIICHFLDGKDQSNKHLTLSASDIFMSLSDNIQETFGITPLEGMASGIPVIVSDWDGYKDTVRDNKDGFRIKTISVGEGEGQDLAYNHMIGNINYDHYVGLSAQRIAVDIGDLIEKLTELILNEDKRKEFGNNGKLRVKNHYDWPIILKQYSDLSDVLDAIRTSAKSRKSNSLPSDRLDPFDVFSSYPTFKLDDKLEVYKTEGIIGMTINDALTLESVKFSETHKPEADNLLAIYNLFKDNKAIKVKDIRSESEFELSKLDKIIIFLLKFGYLSVKSN